MPFSERSSEKRRVEIERHHLYKLWGIFISAVAAVAGTGTLLAVR